MKMSSNDDHLNDEQILEWIEMRETINKINDETFTQKLKRKVKENPMVPFGVAATTFCLTYGLLSMKRGDSRTQQIMMRGRVLAQGFTITALIGGIMTALVSDRNKTDPHVDS